MNKYYSIFSLIMSEGKPQNNKKGGIRNLTNQVLHLSPADLLDIFETHAIARKKLHTELQMFQAGITATSTLRRGGTIVETNYWTRTQLILHNCPHSFVKSTIRNAIARTMCHFLVKPTRKPTSNRVWALYSSK